MIIDYSPTTGPIRYELSDIPSRQTDEFGEPLIRFMFENKGSRGRVILYLRPEELDRMQAARRKQRK